MYRQLKTINKKKIFFYIVSLYKRKILINFQNFWNEITRTNIKFEFSFLLQYLIFVTECNFSCLCSFNFYLFEKNFSVLWVLESVFLVHFYNQILVLLYSKFENFCQISPTHIIFPSCFFRFLDMLKILSNKQIIRFAHHTIFNEEHKLNTLLWGKYAKDLKFKSKNFIYLKPNHYFFKFKIS